MSVESTHVAIAGASGHLGKHLVDAFTLPQFRQSFSQITLLTRQPKDQAAQSKNPQNGVLTRYYDENDLSSSLDGIDILVNVVGSSGSALKDKLLYAVANSKVKLYIPSEFGVDHYIHDFPYPEWDAKKKHFQKAQELLPNVHICRIFIGLFLEDSIGPWFGFNTRTSKYEAIGSSKVPITFTSLDDVGKAVARLVSLPTDSIPPTLHLAGDTLSFESIAKIMESAGSAKIEISEIDLADYKQKALGGEVSDPSGALRFLMGEGKINHTADGLGNDDDVVNPNEEIWKWKTMTDLAKDTDGKPWGEFVWPSKKD